MTRLYVQVPVVAGAEKVEDYDQLAEKVGNDMSSTPVTELHYKERILNHPQRGMDTLVYSMEGTPKL